MDFFGHQDRALGMTRKLLVYYFLALLGTILAAYGLIVVVCGALEHEKRKPTWERTDGGITLGIEAPFSGNRWFDPELFFAVTGVTTLLVLLGSAWKTHEFAGGGATVATMLGGRPVPPGTSDPAKMRLLNVVEEMAIASGLPVPGVYLLDEEEGINAFAAGHTPSDAVIGVTRGTLDHLTRDELQGVVAHEFSHILNGDMKLNMRLTCMTHGILFLAVVGRSLLESLEHVRFSSSRNDKGGGGIILMVVLAGLGLYLLGSVGYFFTSIIQAAVSRQREFLADAAAVQFTRNPHGIGQALMKIAGMGKKNRLHSSHAMEAGHFFFTDSVVSRWLELGSTHPSIEERIRRVAPDLLREEVIDQFLGRLPEVEAGKKSRARTHAAAFAGHGGISGFPQSGDPNTVAGVLPAYPDPAHLEYAAGLLAQLPSAIQEAVREPYGARAVVFALLISHDPDVAKEQLERLRRLSEPMLRQETLLIRETVRRLDRRVLLPLVDLAQPTLRLLSPAAYREFRLALDGLVEADGEIGLLEYALLKLIKRRLDPLFHPEQRHEGERLDLAEAWPDIQILLGALAYQNADPAWAFGVGMAQYGSDTGRVPLPAPEACGLAEADRALEQLTQLDPSDRSDLVQACAQTVMADGTWTAEEGELLRAIADHFDCSIPPFLVDVISV
jgi:Zn-dependent protease with chaperone function